VHGDWHDERGMMSGGMMSDGMMSGAAEAR